MEKRSSSRGNGSYLPALVVAVALLALLLPSCRHGKAGYQRDEDRYAQLDSMMDGIGNVDSLEALARQSHEQNDAMGEMLALGHEGDQLRTQARYVEAIDAHRRGLEVASARSDTLESALMLCGMAEDHLRQGDMCEANGYYFQALKLCDYFSDQDNKGVDIAIASALNGIGYIEIELNNYAQADSVLREALWREQKLGRYIGMAKDYGDLGRLKRDMGELDSAWYYQRKSLEYNQLAGDEKGVALCHLHFGELHNADNRISHAIEEYKVAYDMLKVIGDPWHSLDACLALARAYLLMGEEEQARVYINEAEEESHRIGSKEYQAEAHLVHYEYSLLQGDSKQALSHYVRGTELMDSIYGRQQSEEMRKQRNDYVNGRLSGEMDVLNRDISQLKHRSTMRLIFGALLFLMAAGIIAALIYAVRVRARTQRLMRQVEETRSLFFTNVVHMIRTPLSAIMGAIDGIVARDKTDAVPNAGDDVQQENYAIIERQGNNLLELVDRILEVGSVRSAITELDWRTCDAVTFIHMVLESYRERCMERHIELTYAPSENDVDIVTVPRYLKTIVSSLIDNAINYGNDFGKITVTTHVEGGMFVIRVADNGMGISKADLPHVFEPFYRSAAAESLIDGMGIGLTVVRDMTMALGGLVAADSKQEHGSVFTVKLPCRHGQGVMERFDAAIEPLTDKLPRLQRRRQELSLPETAVHENVPVVLVVEDHVDVARLVGLVLGENYNVHYATDGEQGIAKADELVPDLIITDVKMPLLDGLDMCRYLRQNPKLCHIPVIMLSALNSDSDRIRGIEAGADAYMVKPFVSEELRAWVARLLENRQMLRNVFAASEQADPVEASLHQTEEKDVEDTAKFLDEFAREVDKQFVDCSRIDIDKVARSFKMGESQLRRRIQELTGKSVPAYISQLRMEKAMRLLKNSSPDTLISTIAEQCGFQDVAYFSRVFRQHYDMTPTQARNGNGAG